MKRNEMLKWLVQNVKVWPAGVNGAHSGINLPDPQWDWDMKMGNWFVAAPRENAISHNHWRDAGGAGGWLAVTRRIEQPGSLQHPPMPGDAQLKELAELLNCEPRMVFAKVVEMMPDWNNVPISATTPLQLIWCGPTGAKYPTSVFLDRPKGAPDADVVKDLLERYDRKALLEALQQ